MDSSCLKVLARLCWILHLMMHQMVSNGESSGKVNTQTLLLRRHAVVMDAACGSALSLPERDVWMGAYADLKPLVNAFADVYE